MVTLVYLALRTATGSEAVVWAAGVLQVTSSEPVNSTGICYVTRCLLPDTLTVQTSQDEHLVDVVTGWRM